MCLLFLSWFTWLRTMKTMHALSVKALRNSLKCWKKQTDIGGVLLSLNSYKFMANVFMEVIVLVEVGRTFSFYLFINFSTSANNCNKLPWGKGNWNEKTGWFLDYILFVILKTTNRKSSLSHWGRISMEFHRGNFIITSLKITTF